MSTNHMVAVCDILGFTEMVKANSADAIAEDVLKWIRQSLHHSIHKADFPVETPSLEDLQNHPQIGMAWFSDTILLYTKEDTDENIRELISTVQWFLFETLLTNSRIRCGISYGEMVIDPKNSIYVGQPLIEAFRLEKKQAWAGGALTLKAGERIPEIYRSGAYLDWPIIPYDVPLKKELSFETLAINWTLGIHSKRNFNFAWNKENSEPTEQDWVARPDICEKWKYTKAFHDNVCKTCSR